MFRKRTLKLISLFVKQIKHNQSKDNRVYRIDKMKMKSPKILSINALAFSSNIVISLGMHSTPQLRRNIIDTAAVPTNDMMEVERKLSESDLPWYGTEEIKLNQEPCMSMNVEVTEFIEDEDTNFRTTEVPTESPILQTLQPSTSDDVLDTLSPSTSTQQTTPPSTDEPQTLPPSNSVPQVGELPSTLVPQTSSPTTLFPTPFVSGVAF